MEVFTTTPFFLNEVGLFLEREWSPLEQRFYDGINELITALPVDIYDLEYVTGSKTLRLYIIDRNTGSATLDDCVVVDRALSDWFEEQEWIPEEIILEVSSPGIYRSLHTEQDFMDAKGELVKCEFRRKIKADDFGTTDKRLLEQKKVVGILKEVSPEIAHIEFFEQEYQIPFALLKKINIEFKE